LAHRLGLETDYGVVVGLDFVRTERALVGRHRQAAVAGEPPPAEAVQTQIRVGASVAVERSAARDEDGRDGVEARAVGADGIDARGRVTTGAGERHGDEAPTGDRKDSALQNVTSNRVVTSTLHRSFT